MLKLIHILPILLAVGLQAQSKKDNAILIPGNVPLSKVKTVLFTNGYALEENSDSMFISTHPKELSRYYIAIKFMVAKTDSVTYLKGLWKDTQVYRTRGYQTESEYALLEYRKGLIGSTQVAWTEMEKIAKQLSDKIKYTRQ